MSPNSFENVTYKNMRLQIKYLIYNLALDNQQGFLFHRTQPTQNSRLSYKGVFYYFILKSIFILYFKLI